MLKTFRKMKNKPVTVSFRNGDDNIGGGMALGQPEIVLLLLEVDYLWVALRWQWSGETIVILASDIACIADDIAMEA